jgi:glycosyltransferase involved in cell wall biosynthesis
MAAPLSHLVFAHDTRFVHAPDGLVYSDRGSFPWDRYLAVAERLTVVSRARGLAPGETTERMALVSRPEVSFVTLPNLSSPVGRLVRRRGARAALARVLGDADGLVARLPSEIGGVACRVADGLGLRWAAEVVTCPWDALWNYGTWQGRVFAPLAWREMRALLRRAPFSLYVTEEFLQRRYPPGGHAVGCSDVDIGEPGPEVLERRLARIDSQARPLVFGTIAALLPFKGLDTAFAALARAAADLPPFEFRILGAGEREPIARQATAAGLSDRVHFDGTLPAGDAVLGWLDDIDVYLQPSRQEGLPRALLEAMSRGCPALGSTAGGIPELLASDCLHRPGDVEALARLLTRSVDPQWQATQAQANAATASRYAPAVLDDRRSRFWESFAAARPAPRVLFVAPYAQLGGSERQLLDAVDAAGGDVVVLQRGPLLDRLRDRGVEPVVVPTSAGPLDLLRAAWSVRAELRRRRPEVVHGDCAKGALVAGIAAFGSGIPVVYAKHDFFSDGPVAWAAAALSRAVVSGSHALNETFPPLLRRRLHVVHPGVGPVEVDAVQGRRRVQALTGVNDGVPVVAVVGRLHPVKGHLELVEALPSMATEAHALLVGGVESSVPEWRATVERRVAALGLADRVTFAGEQEGVAELLSGCDVALVPTVVDERGMGREGFGLVGVEAFWAGTPVVGYDHGGFPEVVGDCGVLVPPGDRVALAAAVDRLLADADERRRLVECGRARAHRFTVAQRTRGVQAVYEAATSRVRSARRSPQARRE